MTPLLLAVLSVAVDAPITDVTVFGDRARVVRSASLSLTGPQAVELPMLPESVDTASIRVELSGGEVRKVDIERISPENANHEESRALSAELETIDVAITRASLERSAVLAQRDGLLKLSPSLAGSDPTKPPPKLNGAGWGQVDAFLNESTSKLQNRVREADQLLKKLAEQRQALVEKMARLGNPEHRAAWRVVANVSGHGGARLTCTYLVPGATWSPVWDVQLDQAKSEVNVSLAAVVTQHTLEAWLNTPLHLSTATPLSVVQLPTLSTWKVGASERFMPAPARVETPPAPPPAPPPPPPISVQRPEPRPREAEERSKIEYDDRRVVAGVVAPAVLPGSVAAPAPAAPPPRGEPVMMSESLASTADLGRARPSAEARFSLSAPPAWVAPRLGPDSAAELAGGYDLTFDSLQKETLPSGPETRRVPLWAARWPVSVERKVYPALTNDVFLVAELKNPSAQVLPGGPAQLSVGTEPAGTAQLRLVSPNEAFTLPLGIDRALKPVRNVKLVEATKGLINKDEVGTYAVTIELANPYTEPIEVRVFDQWPVTRQKEVESALTAVSPVATQDAVHGSLEWRARIGANQKSTFTFTYTIKRPKGWQLSASEVSP